MEIGDDQAAAVLRLLEETHALAPGRVRQDLAGRDRVVLARRLLDGVNEKRTTDRTIENEKRTTDNGPMTSVDRLSVVRLKFCIDVH